MLRALKVYAGSPWEHQIPLRPMDWDSGSLRCLNVAKGWLTDCVENHEECLKGTTTLPSRVLDISCSGDLIKLVDGSGLSGRYASLSYCVSDPF
jgi:hypothetical protein